MAGFEAATMDPEVDFEVVGACGDVVADVVNGVSTAVSDDCWPAAAGEEVREGGGGLRHYPAMVLAWGLTGCRGETGTSPLAMSSSRSSSVIR